MRPFLLLLFAAATRATPQNEYNYQIQVDSSLRNDLTKHQYRFLQQLEGAQQSQLYHLFEVPKTASVTQPVKQVNNNVAAEYHFENQLVQQAQVAQYEQEQLKEHYQTVDQPESKPENIQQQTQSTPVQLVKPMVPASVIKNTATLTRQKKNHIESESVIQFQIRPQPEASHQMVPQHRHKSQQYNKEFYYLSAPQEDFEQSHELNEHFDTLSKNLRVLFIRTPENNHIEDAAVKLAKQSLEQQTIVYVLTKQHDAADLASKFEQIRTNSKSKPDVVFIKYRKPEEAEHAQRTIQAQYETLDGPNHYNHEGVAPTHNFIGTTSGLHTGSVVLNPRKSSKSSSAEISSSKYLPSPFKL